MLDAIARSLMVLVGFSLLVVVPLMVLYSSDGSPRRFEDGLSVAVSAIGVAVVLLCAVTGAAFIYGAVFALPVVMR
jgi:hypothetical protein